MDNLTVPLVVGTSFIVRFAKRKFPMERCIVPFPSRRVPIITEYLPPSDSLAVLQSNADVESNTDDQSDNAKRYQSSELESVLRSL